VAVTRTSLPGEYGRALTALARHNVEFVICGGLACFLHGSSRNTRDIDLAVRLERDNLGRLIEAAKELGLKPRIPEPLEAIMDDQRRAEWLHMKNALVFTIVSLESPLQIDVFLSYPIAFEELLRKADAVTIDDVTFRISSKQHLIQAKRMVQPPRFEDEFDIKFLQEQINREERERHKSPDRS
jgi:hypothetical protein